ncbi:C69 family dipeptidase [Streptococcus sanguinis]|uniref:C69 family dipeptidase n=1 Tax=Streptococcus sanguinis TaxID=1305 RepID=UPI001CBD2904|nr:C69 family dipeptidase [Streptococcus sanguinis]MBZ2022494.1 C69 family dipeptidase [Streptococcus sanguinis]MBZ2047192.1 C69 family dipeptidase [Streptococcus sanguinis]MBZ2050113.1 C69 family dipeptidase [Streptococcus sanguinis]MBZ2058761.1 C69 family dipeptidase [Streptococcus sanguinis]MCC3177958.1 peptidase C69 family protein [Streptococcus sanguinis]
MKKKFFSWAIPALMLLTLFPFQAVSACTGFIIGKDLTTDGSTLYGRTEDLEPNHNKNFVVRERKYNKAGDKFVDETNGFSFDLPAVSYKYTAVPDVTPEQGVFDEAGFNEEGVSISATVSASANDDIQKVDPYVKDGIAESALTSVILPHVKTAKEGVELLAKIVREKGAAEGNIVTIADKTGVWYMEILSGHQYAAIKFPDDKYAVFPNTFFLGSVDKNDTENTILSADLEKIAQDAGTYKEINGSFHVAQSYNPPLAEADRSRVWSGIKALDPNADVQYDDEYFELMHSTSDKLSLRDAMNLQRNRLEGTDFKPQDQMELDGKGIPDKTKADPVYKYPISNPNVMEAHIFQLKDNLPANTGGGILWLAMGSPRNAPYLPYYGNISNTSQPYQEMSTAYNENSWYWTVSRINDLVAKYPELFEDGSIRTEIERMESQWMEEQPAHDNEQISLSEQPEQASLKATKDSMERADSVFKRLKEIQKIAEDKVVAEYGTSALEEIEELEDSDTEETIRLEDFDYDIAIAGGIFVLTVIGIAIYLVKGKNRKGADSHE